MLELKEISKVYEVADQSVQALKNISLTFRRTEFVSILGPSGCGKTTLLNIIGGLDKYSQGDLVVSGISTKDYKDRDWDTYRNHKIGFVFQSYNLIPHQTVLENVELALTLSGVKRDERKRRAKAVLEKVGLGDKLKNKPSQLSGGQMQRVAIARALVNDPEIILADEPTGALDTTTSVQIMELLKEISKDKLIIMVTHNPSLAEKYSTRIINLLDGDLTGDSNPFTEKDMLLEIASEKKQAIVLEEQKTSVKKVKPHKTRMSFLTATMLSLKNLLTKKTRTILVSVAGSIGIIGIALVLSISSGFSNYVNKMQEDTLSTYPLTIEAKNVDFSSVVMSMFLNKNAKEDANHELDAVYDKDSISTVINNVGSNLSANNLTAFYSYLQTHYGDIKNYVNAVAYTYDLDLEFYQEAGANIQPNSNVILKMITKYAIAFFQNKTKIGITVNPNSTYTLSKTASTDYAFVRQYADLAYIETGLEADGSLVLNAGEVISLTTAILGLREESLSGSVSTFGDMDVFYEMINNQPLIESQYSLLGENGKFATESNEAILVLDKNNEVDEYVLYALGLLSETDMDKLMKDLVEGKSAPKKIDYSSVLGKKFKVLEESDYFVLEGEDLVDFRNYKSTDQVKYAQCYATAIANCTNFLTIVGIVKTNQTTESGCLKTGVAYTKNLTESMLTYHNQSTAKTSGKINALSLGTPSSVSIYVNTFEAKNHVKQFIDDYNKSAQNGDQISYSDYVGLIMSTVSTIINAITYVLIAFVAVSLLVSSIMIGIITYISVIERTKEIGILRSVGASKGDIKRVFTSESFIIGFSSGVLGIVVALLLLLPINLVLRHFTSISSLATLPPLGAVILIVISVALTLIAGLIPANIAAKKDPVVALREN